MSTFFLITPGRAFVLGGLVFLLAMEAVRATARWWADRKVARTIEKILGSSNTHSAWNQILRASPSADPSGPLDRELDRLERAFCEGVREATDLMAVGVPITNAEVKVEVARDLAGTGIDKVSESIRQGLRIDRHWRTSKISEIQAKLTLARNTAARATSPEVVARCAGRAEAFEVGLGEPEALARLGYRGPIADPSEEVSAIRVHGLRMRADQRLRAPFLVSQQRSR